MQHICQPDGASCLFFTLLGEPGYSSPYLVDSSRVGQVRSAGAPDFFSSPASELDNISAASELDPTTSSININDIDDIQRPTTSESIVQAPRSPHSSSGGTAIIINNSNPHAHKCAKIPEKYGNAIREFLVDKHNLAPTDMLYQLTRRFWIGNVSPSDWPGDERLKNKLKTMRRQLNRAAARATL